MLTRQLLVVMLAVSAAHAQPADPPPDAAEPVKPWAAGVSAERQAAALALFEAGNREFGELHYGEALARYREALAQWDHPSIRFNIAVCLIHLDAILEADDNLEVGMRYGAAALGEDVFQQGLTYRKLLDGQLADVSITASEHGASVTLDGRRLFVGPGSVRLHVLPGAHQVVATKPGFLTSSQAVDARARQRLSVDVRLVAFTSTATMVRRWAPWRPWAVVGGGAVIVGAGALAYLTARHDFIDYDATVVRECPGGCTPQRAVELGLHSTRQHADAWQTTARVLFAAGGVSLAFGIVGVVLNLPQTQLVPVDVAPTRGGAVASKTWRF